MTVVVVVVVVEVVVLVLVVLFLVVLLRAASVLGVLQRTARCLSQGQRRLGRLVGQSVGEHGRRPVLLHQRRWCTHRQRRFGRVLDAATGRVGTVAAAALAEGAGHGQRHG